MPLPDHPMVADVMQGSRYVIYPFVVSILVLSFRRNFGGVRVVRTGSWPIVPLFGAALTTIALGWWGFPWGLIWSPIALFQLWNGGRDFTKDILSNEIGMPEAQRVLAMAPKPKPPASIWLVRLMILVPVFLFGSLVLGIALAGSDDGTRHRPSKVEHRPASTEHRR